MLKLNLIILSEQFCIYYYLNKGTYIIDLDELFSNIDTFRFQIELKFEEPFYGRAYADFDRSSACTVTGKGNTSARIDLPLKGCGTKQVCRKITLW